MTRLAVNPIDPLSLGSLPDACQNLPTSSALLFSASLFYLFFYLCIPQTVPSKTWQCESDSRFVCLTIHVALFFIFSFLIRLQATRVVLGLRESPSRSKIINETRGLAGRPRHVMWIVINRSFSFDFGGPIFTSYWWLRFYTELYVIWQDPGQRHQQQRGNASSVRRKSPFLPSIYSSRTPISTGELIDTNSTGRASNSSLRFVLYFFTAGDGTNNRLIFVHWLRSYQRYLDYG
jgi:hypothetical protein